MPKLIGECGDVPLFVVSDYLGGLPGPGLLMLVSAGKPCWSAQGLVWSFHVRSGDLLFSVVLGAAAVGMDSKVPVLERYLL